MASKVRGKEGNIRVNVLINLIRTLAMTALSFITFPYVTRALGEQAFGVYTWANTFVYYFLVLARISIPNIAIRECAKVKDDKEALSHKAQEYFILQAITTLLSFGLECALVFSVPSLYEHNGLIFLLSINFLIGVFSFEWIYIALEKHLYITVRSVSLIAFAALLTFLVIRPTDYGMHEVHIYALLTITPTLLTALFNVIMLPRYISFKKTRPYDFKALIKPLWVLFLISLFVTAYNQTDMFLLGFLDPTKKEVGAYSVGVKGIDIVITLITSLYAVFMPRASYYYAKEDKKYFRNLLRYSFNITFFIAIPAIATMASMSSPIVTLISGENGYANAAFALMSLAAMMLTFSLSDDIYTEILLPQKREKTYLVIMSLGVVLNIALSLVLGMFVFKDAPLLGVSLATVGTDALVLLSLILATKEYSVPAIFNLNNLKIVLIGAAIGVGSYFLYPVLHGLLPFAGESAWASQLIALVSVVLIDAVVYILALGLCREKLVISFLPKARKRREEESHEEGE